MNMNKIHLNLTKTMYSHFLVFQVM
jgi:hypothetical protein